MNTRIWVESFIFLKELLKRPEIKKLRRRNKTAYNLYLLAFLGMFLFAMIMSEQAFLYSTQKYELRDTIEELEKTNASCEANLQFYYKRYK